MYQSLLADARFHRMLRAIDDDIAAVCRAAGCPACRGVLHSARYPRKPRGCPGLRDEPCLRNSFCCAVDGCRKRATPASVRFLGRKVYLATVVSLVSAMQSGAKASGRKLAASLGVDRRTVARWRFWWLFTFAAGSFWRAASPAFVPPVDPHRLPASALERFELAPPARSGNAEQGLIAFLRFLAPITGGTRMQHAF